MDKYIVIRKLALDELRIEVNTQIMNNGYKPLGGIAVTLAKNTNDEIFYQALTQD